MLRENFAQQPNLTKVRSRASTKEEQKAFLKEAAISWLRSQSDTTDEYGRVPLQEYDRSDMYWSFDLANLENVEFIFDEVRTDFHDRSGPPSVEAILGRTLRGDISLLDIFWNKQALCDQALVEQTDGSCVRKQLYTVLKRRHREFEPRINGVQNPTPVID